jgi:hypothetical protein
MRKKLRDGQNVVQNICTLVPIYLCDNYISSTGWPDDYVKNGPKCVFWAIVAYFHRIKWCFSFKQQCYDNLLSLNSINLSRIRHFLKLQHRPQIHRVCMVEMNIPFFFRKHNGCEYLNNLAFYANLCKTRCLRPFM